jgi:hypothetical protein
MWVEPEAHATPSPLWIRWLDLISGAADKVLNQIVLEFYARLWCSTHKQILDFTGSLPSEQTCLVHAEDLLSNF